MTVTVREKLARLNTPVALLLGGRSAERAISLQSGEAVATALGNLGIAFERVDPADANWLSAMTGRYRYAFNALHGVGGEDGTVQGALESIGVRYTGSGVLASALAMDKLRCKQLWRGIGLPTPDFAVLDQNSDWSMIMRELGTAMVKPAHEGSSIGMARVSTDLELENAFNEASQFDSSVIAEQWISGAEFTVGILGEQVLPAIRLQTKRGFYDFDAKYVDNDTQYILPCGLEQKKLDELNAIAKRAFASLGCKGWGRIDFMQDASGEFYLLEVNTIPGLTSHSLVPMAAKATGLSFDDLVVAVLAECIVDEA